VSDSSVHLVWKNNTSCSYSRWSGQTWQNVQFC